MSKIASTMALNGGWLCQPDWDNPAIDHLLAGIFKRGEWCPATVPGTIHTDLMAANKIPDPFYHDNENQVQWVGKVGWRYYRRFEIEPGFLKADSIELCAEGLDTFATILINGQEVGRVDNMFIPHRFEVQACLHAGENEIEIVFDSPLQRTRALEEKYGKLAAARKNYRVFARKAQYSFGWDWGPDLPTSGIWRPIYLLPCGKLRLQNIRIDSNLHASLQHATVVIRVDCEMTGNQSIQWTATLEGPRFNKMIRKEGKDTQQSFCFEIDHPHLWWPNGLGEQVFYDLHLQAEVANSEPVTVHRRIGLRQVEFITEPEADGEAFRLQINHVPVYCKGANWIPSDSFIPRITREKYQALLTLARDANMNILRVWGGGIYEQPEFYNLCDELGLMIWQDFMFACASYPEHEEFVQNVQREVKTIVRQLRDHPSIVLWCGNNENEWIWYRTTGRPATEMPGAHLFDTLIPTILSAEDSSRPYRQSSPFGGEDPNAEAFGNRHQWDLWSGWVSPVAVQRDRSRFVTEFGFQSPACLETWQESVQADQLWPQSPVVEHHNKQVEGTERLYRYLAAYFKIPQSFDEFVYKCQVMQAEALKTCIEHWRSQKFLTSGSLIWQLNDCWPVSSWSIVDSALRLKAAYWYARRFYAPLILVIREKNDLMEILAVNDTLQDFAGELEVTTHTLGGDTNQIYQGHAAIPANSAVKLFAHPRAALEMADPLDQYMRTRFFARGEVIAVNRYFFAPFKHLRLEPPDMQTKLAQEDERLWRLKITPDRFVKALYIQPADEKLTVSDNFIDIDAGKSVAIEIRSSQPGLNLSLSDFAFRWI